MVEGCIGILQMAIQEGGKNPTQSGLIFYCHIFQEFYNLNHPIYSNVLNQLGLKQRILSLLGKILAKARFELWTSQSR